MTETAATTGTSTGSVERKPGGGGGRAVESEDSAPTGAAQDQEAAAFAAPDASEEPDQPDAVDPQPELPASPPPPPVASLPGGGGGSASARPGGAGPGGAAGAAAFTRPPGMAPPPETPEDEQAVRRDTTASMPAAVGVPSSPVLSGPPRASDASATGSFPVVSASAPVAAPPRPTGQATTSGVTMRPIGPSSSPGGPAVGAVRVTEAVRPSRQSATTPRGPRRARLNVKRIDPWSVMKFSFAVSLVLFIVVIVAASVLYLALDSMGVFTSINETVADLVESGGGEGETFRITARGVIGSAGVLGALNVLLFTSLATLGAFIYNVCADLVGGVEVTLTERD